MSDIDKTPSAPPENDTAKADVRVRPYAPFPRFAEWLNAAPELATFDEYSAQLSELRASAGVEALQQAVEVATRWAAIDTGAIEGLYEVERGFTITMAVSGAILENIHAIKGEAVARSVEDALSAYEFVLDVATQARPITEVWIRELHAKICRSQGYYTVSTAVGPQEHELEKGKYKVYPNSPYNFDAAEVHSYAAPEMTPPEMARLVSELRSDEFVNAHPVVQAAYAHYAFVCIHPFPDGNGRVSRALASAFLYRSPGMPLVVFADQKSGYISALEAADLGQYGAFVRFISERAIDTVGMIRESIASASTPSVLTQLAQLDAMSTGRGGLPHKELDAVAVRLLEQFAASADKVMAEQFQSTPVTPGVARSSGYGQLLREGYRLIPGNPLAVFLQLNIAEPAQGQVSRVFFVLVAKPDVEGPDFIIGRDPAFATEVFLREVHPVISGALAYRLDALVEANVREMMAELMTLVQRGLTNQGYAV